MIANSRHYLFSTDSLGDKNFLEQHHKQMMPELLKSHPSVWSLYTIYAAAHLFKFRREITGAHDVFILAYISNYIQYFNLFNLNVQFIQCCC